MLFLAGVNYEHDRDTAGAADGMPALLFLDHAIHVRHDIRIFEDSRRRLKENAVFPVVDTVLLLIPREDHLYIRNCSTSLRGIQYTPMTDRQEDPVAARMIACPATRAKLKLVSRF